MSETVDNSNAITRYFERQMAECMRRQAETPWWCHLCGAGGNGWTDGMDVTDAWFPPTSHTCRPTPCQYEGIELR